MSSVSSIKNMEEELQQKETKQRRKPNRYILNILFVLLIAALSFYFLLKDDFGVIIENFKNSDPKYIAYLFGIMILSYIIEGFILLAFARLYTTKYYLHQAIANAMIGVFYNGITPSSSGGQFVQAYTFKKQGVDMAGAASIVVMHFIVSQFVLVVLGAIALITKYNDFVGKIGTIIIFDIEFSAVGLSILGFIINTLVIFGLLFMSYSKKLHAFILKTGVNIGARIRIVRDKEKTRKNLQVQVENFRIELRRLQSNIPFTILMVFFFFVRYILIYSIPYVSGLALKSDMQGSLFDGIAMASYLQMVTGMIPLPGAAGGAEYFFGKLYNSFYGSTAITNAAIIMWRTATFYFGLIIGGFVSALYRTTEKEVASPGKSEFQTFVDLQISTFEERKKSSDTAFATKQLSRKDIEDRIKKLKFSIFKTKKKTEGPKASDDKKEREIDGDNE